MNQEPQLGGGYRKEKSSDGVCWSRQPQQKQLWAAPFRLVSRWHITIHLPGGSYHCKWAWPQSNLSTLPHPWLLSPSDHIRVKQLRGVKATTCNHQPEIAWRDRLLTSQALCECLSPAGAWVEAHADNLVGHLHPGCPESLCHQWGGGEQCTQNAPWDRVIRELLAKPVCPQRPGQHLADLRLQTQSVTFLPSVVRPHSNGGVSILAELSPLALTHPVNKTSPLEVSRHQGCNLVS